MMAAAAVVATQERERERKNVREREAGLQQRLHGTMQVGARHLLRVALQAPPIEGLRWSMVVGSE